MFRIVSIFFLLSTAVSSIAFAGSSIDCIKATQRSISIVESRIAEIGDREYLQRKENSLYARNYFKKSDEIQLLKKQKNDLAFFMEIARGTPGPIIIGRLTELREIYLTHSSNVVDLIDINSLMILLQEKLKNSDCTYYDISNDVPDSRDSAYENRRIIDWINDAVFCKLIPKNSSFYDEAYCSSGDET